MHLPVALLLWSGAPSIAADLANVEPAVEASPAKATGEPTEGERRFQGDWDYSHVGSENSAGTLRIYGRAFHADIVHGNYRGYITIRPGNSPSQIDFTIEQCGCKYEGMTTAGIYYEDDGDIVFTGIEPGKSRPETFTGKDDLVRLRPLDPATAGDGE